MEEGEDISIFVMKMEIKKWPLKKEKHDKGRKCSHDSWLCSYLFLVSRKIAYCTVTKSGYQVLAKCN